MPSSDLTPHSDPSRLLRATYLQPEGLKEMNGLVAFYKENAGILLQAFQEMGFKVYGGRDAPYVWVGFPGKASWWVQGRLSRLAGTCACVRACTRVLLLACLLACSLRE
jgi:hypothetical protein